MIRFGTVTSGIGRSRPVIIREPTSGVFFNRLFCSVRFEGVET